MNYQKSMFLILLATICALTGCQPEGTQRPDEAQGVKTFRPLVRLAYEVSEHRSRLFGRPFRPQGAITLTWDVISGPASGVSFASDGSVAMTGGQEIIVRSRQVVGANFFLEVTLPADFGNTQHLPFIGLDSYPIASTGTNLWGINSISNKIRVDGQSKSYSAKAGDRIAMEARDGVVRYYKNYSGLSSTPFYVSRLPPIQGNLPITMVKPIGGRVGEEWIAGAVKLSNSAPVQ